MAIEIVDFPINSMVDRSMAKCKRSPGRVFLLLDPIDFPKPGRHIGAPSRRDGATLGGVARLVN